MYKRIYLASILAVIVSIAAFFYHTSDSTSLLDYLNSRLSHLAVPLISTHNLSVPEMAAVSVSRNVVKKVLSVETPEVDRARCLYH